MGVLNIPKKTMTINVANLQKKVSLNPQRVQKIITTILRREGLKKTSLSVAFVTAQKIRALNQKFLKHSYPTDVLAFDLTEPFLLKSRFLFGKRKLSQWEIIISTDAAIQNAKRFKTSVREEMTLYVIHGLLHLLGYDDHRSKDVERIRTKEQELLNFLNGKTV